jgi:hypothetical protein
MELHTQGVDDFQDGVEAGTAFAGKGLVEALTG